MKQAEEEALSFDEGEHSPRQVGRGILQRMAAEEVMMFAEPELCFRLFLCGVNNVNIRWSAGKYKRTDRMRVRIRQYGKKRTTF